VPARTPEGLSLSLVDPRAAGVTLAPMVGIDVGNRWSEMRLDDPAVRADALVGRPGGAGSVLDALLRRAAVCASAEVLGAPRWCRSAPCVGRGGGPPPGWWGGGAAGPT